MVTRSISLPATSWLRSKYVVFGFIALMMAYVLNHNERFLIKAGDPSWQHY